MLDITALEPKIAEAAKLMEMLSQPVRLRLMCILLDGEQSVLSLADSAGLSQPAMSHHLKKLRDAELVETRRDGQTIYYIITDATPSSTAEIMGIPFSPAYDNLITNSSAADLFHFKNKTIEKLNYHKFLI